MPRARLAVAPWLRDHLRRLSGAFKALSTKHGVDEKTRISRAIATLRLRRTDHPFRQFDELHAALSDASIIAAAKGKTDFTWDAAPLNQKRVTGGNSRRQKSIAKANRIVQRAAEIARNSR